MKTIERASGLKVILPPQFEIVETNKPSRKKPRSRRGGPFRPVRMPTGGKSTPMASDMMTAAFGGQEMQLLDQVEIDPGDEARRDTRRKRSPQVIEFNLEVGQKEDAVVLLEQDGMYSWQFPGKDTSRQKRSHRGAYTDADFTRNIKFRIPLTSHPADKRPSGKRGLIEDFVMDKIRAYIFKFAARVAVGQVMKYLERNVQRGLINMRNIEDAAKWELISDPASLKLPKNRPARILLFVHGTFSSTIGGYGVLTATPWGREFLRAAHSNYDAVIGFDHATLSEDPLENATDLLHCLQAIRWPVPPRFDVITHSRGGLVIRSLLEHLLPLDDFSPAFERVIFVAVTNGGTQLAEPDNWNTLIDMYTNISAAAFRLIGMLPQAKGATVLLNEIVKGVGALVKYCAATAIDEREVPGLAAMEPNGKFILRLNEQQLKQPTIKNSYYCAITSDFKPDLTGDDIEPKELPSRFLFWAANVFADQLMKEPNDLVVNTASMTHVDPQVGRYIKDSLDFGTNPHLYHTNYFVQPDVIGALTRWLSLAAEPVSKGKRRSVAAGKEEAYLDLLAKALPPSDSVALGGLSRIELPAMVDTDIFITNAMAPFNEVANLIERKKPSYLVIRREYLGNTLNYAFPAEDVLSMGGGPGNQTSLLDALNLHESDRSNDLSLVSLTKPVTMTGGSAVARRGVVLIGEEPVGVLPEKIAPSGAATLADLVRLTTAPKTSGDEIRARRIMPTLQPRTVDVSLISPPETIHYPKRGPGSGRVSVSSLTCHFRAEMEQQVILNRSATIELTVSRERIDQIIHAAAVEGQAEVDPKRKLSFRVIPKINFEVLGADIQEDDPPQPGTPKQYYFYVKPAHVGEGEVWVVVRQGQVPLVTLILKPEIVKTAGGAIRRAVSTATTPEAPKLAAPLHQLMIVEQRNGKELTYLFELQSPELQLLKLGTSKPIKGDRAKYVAGLYEEIENRWVSNKEDIENFTQELREIGADMFDQLLPLDLQEALWKYRKRIHSILVLAEEPFIPWELVHIKQPGKGLTKEMCFLGQMGLVRWLHEAGWPKEQLRIQKGRGRYVIPNYPHPDYALPEARQEAAFLEKKFGATAVVPKSSVVRNLLSTPGGFDLLHFAGHGAADSQNIANAQLLLEGRVEGSTYIPDTFSETTVEQNANLSKEGSPPPLVVLNACQAGRAGYKLTGIGGFARAFLRHGAGAFVGTLWSVGDAPARSFTEEFYTRLQKKATIAEAAIAAREAARKAGDATWLAYVVYGHPHARLKTK